MTFVDYFGNTPRARLLDFLGDHPTSDYNITEMANKAGITRQTVYAQLEDLEDQQMVVETRKVGQSAMYQINMNHPVVQSVMAADMLVARDGKKTILAHAQ